MILPIVNYGDPVLRARGARIETFDSELHELVENMLETRAIGHPCFHAIFYHKYI